MTERNKPPQRRILETVEIVHWDQIYTFGIGRSFDTGEVIEIFVNNGKSGTQLETTARESAVIISFAIQHGAALDDMRHAMPRNLDGTPSGPLGALLDLLAKDGSNPPEPQPAGPPGNPDIDSVESQLKELTKIMTLHDLPARMRAVAANKIAEILELTAEPEHAQQ